MSSPYVKDWWKVPFRMVYCETFRGWLAETIYCHVCLRIDPPKFDGNIPA